MCMLEVCTIGERCVCLDSISGTFRALNSISNSNPSHILIGLSESARHPPKRAASNQTLNSGPPNFRGSAINCLTFSSINDISLGRLSATKLAAPFGLSFSGPLGAFRCSRAPNRCISRHLSLKPLAFQRFRQRRPSVRRFFATDWPQKTCPILQAPSNGW